MEQNIKTLIENINNCNLSNEDKLILLEKLESKNPDIENFLIAFLKTCRVSNKILEAFENDIFDIF